MPAAADPWAPLRAVRSDLPWEKLEALAAELHRWNRRIRLVGPRTLEGVRLQIADALLPFLPEPPEGPFLDIGTGPGLPLLPVSLVHPQLACTGLEPRSKRIAFVRHAARVLRLPNVTVFQGRAPEILDPHPELAAAFRTVTARAVADIEAALLLAAPFLAPGGAVVLPRAGEPAIQPPGWVLVACHELPRLPGLGPRSLLVYRGGLGPSAR